MKTKNFNFRVNYLLNKVEWTIKTDFVIENLNIYDMQKQTCEYENLNYRKSNCWRTQSQIHLDR